MIEVIMATIAIASGEIVQRPFENLDTCNSGKKLAMESMLPYYPFDPLAVNWTCFEVVLRR